MINFAISDSFHLHERNFPSLFKALESRNISYTTLLSKESDGYGLITALGNYDDLEERVGALIARSIRSQAEVYRSRSADELYAEESLNLPLWPLCRSELLAYLLTFDSWQDKIRVKDDRAIFDKAYAENRESLALNMAVAIYWLNHWYDMRKKLFSHQFACVFSGSMTYTRTLMEILRRSPTKVFVVESTFTGNDFIFEEMYYPSANNLGVKHATLRAARRNPVFEQPDQYDREIIKARNKVLSTKNKNVVQPSEEALPRFPNNMEKQVLIVGQVVNDFSLIEDGFPYLGSIAVYRDIIDRILAETNYNIVFKSHPWEHKKANLKTAKTLNAMKAHVATLSVEDRARILLVDDVNIFSLIDSSDYFVALCTQAGIEAAFLGLKPFILGQAFYSGAGFTKDCVDIETLVQALAQENGVLSLAEYRHFDRFLVDLFQYGTVSVHDSGAKRIVQMLEQNTPLKQMTPLKTELQLGQTISTPTRSVGEWSFVFHRKEPMPDDLLAKNIIEEGVRLVPLDWPDFFKAGAEVAVPFRIINNSDHIVPTHIMNKEFFLSYHIWGASQGERIEWNGEKTRLPQAIKEDLVVNLTIKAPQTPGKYKLQPAFLLPAEFWITPPEMLEMTVA